MQGFTVLFCFWELVSCQSWMLKLQGYWYANNCGLPKKFHWNSCRTHEPKWVTSWLEFVIIIVYVSSPVVFSRLQIPQRSIPFIKGPSSCFQQVFHVCQQQFQTGCWYDEGLVNSLWWVLFVSCTYAFWNVHVTGSVHYFAQVNIATLLLGWFTTVAIVARMLLF